MDPTDWPEISLIYKQGMDTKNATFQTEVPDWETWDKSHRSDCRSVALSEGHIVGWVALSNYSSRTVYAGVAEVSIYIDDAYRGMGIGSKLMEYLISESENNGIWTLQAGIYPENNASMQLHHKFGFRIVGTREKIGKMDDHWRDVCLLERRSKTVGIN
jgi:L-amino acid N-acyltransferase YncA